MLTTDRRFSRFARTSSGGTGGAVYTTEIPEGGFCLSSFLVISDRGGRILLGHLNPQAPWDHIGALDAERAKVHSRGWMLPSSHRMLLESPQEAALRILDEQLGMRGLELPEPKIVAEVGTPKRFPNLPMHWDFEFIFRMKASSDVAPHHQAWSELRYITRHGASCATST